MADLSHLLSGFDPANGAIALPLWLAAVVAALFVMLATYALRRGSDRRIAVRVARYSMIAGAVLVVLGFLEQGAVRERAAVARALEARAADLVVRTLAPGSPLACLDGLAGDAVQSACEKELFGSPQNVAIAVAFVAARLELMADAEAYAARYDAGFRDKFTSWRNVTQADPYGLVAHVLAQRAGCGTQACDRFALVDDPARIKSNMRENTFAAVVGRHAMVWGSSESKVAIQPREDLQAVADPSETPGQSPPGQTPASQTPPAQSAVPNLSFPSAASIPAVSIMSSEPGVPAAKQNDPAPAAKPIPAKRAETPRRPPAAPPPSSPAPPIQLAPPAQ